MNFLAHLVLPAPLKPLMVGGFLGDFVKGPMDGVLMQGLPQDIKQGIELHRFIDRRSDQHEALQNLKLELPKKWYRYAGIILDMFVDLHLSSDWPQVQLGERIDFCHDAVALLQDHKNHLNPRALRVLNSMQQYSWLESYIEPENIYMSLQRIGSRFSRTNPLQHIYELQEYEQLILQAAAATYSSIQGDVDDWCDHHLPATNV